MRGRDRRRVEVRQRAHEPVAALHDLLGGARRPAAATTSSSPSRAPPASTSASSRSAAHQPLAHAVAQLAGRHPREGDQQQLVQRHALGDVARRQRRDRVRLAGPGARLEHRDARRQRAADVERAAHWSFTASTRSSPPHSRRAYWPKRVASPGIPLLVVARRRLEQRREREPPPRTRARARARGPPSGSGRTPTRPRALPPAHVRRRRAAGQRQRLAHPAVVEIQRAPRSCSSAASTRRRGIARDRDRRLLRSRLRAPDRHRRRTRRSRTAPAAAPTPPSRWRGLTLRVGDRRQQRPRTPGTVPVSRRPSRPRPSRRRTPAPPRAISPRACPAISSTSCQISSTTGRPSCPGGSVPRAISARIAGAAVRTGHQRVRAAARRRPSARARRARPAARRSISSRVVADADPQPLAQERAHRVLDEAHELRRARPAPGRAGQRPAQEPGRPDRSRTSARAPSERDAVEAPGPRPPRSCAGRTAAAGARRTTSAPDDVQQLADRHRGRARGRFVRSSLPV